MIIYVQSIALDFFIEGIALDINTNTMVKFHKFTLQIWIMYKNKLIEILPVHLHGMIILFKQRMEVIKILLYKINFIDIYNEISNLEKSYTNRNIIFWSLNT